MIDKKDIEQAIAKAETGISQYLQQAFETGQIDLPLFEEARVHTLNNIREWLDENKIDRFSPNLRKTIVAYIKLGRWSELVNAFHRQLRFGTAGIRGLMALDKTSILKLKEDGLLADILKGPNTFNEIVLLRTTVGVANYGLKRNFSKVVIGYDSRIRGYELARLVAELFLAFDYTVYFFDTPCPYPELTFAVPHPRLKADMGVLISASHNDYRYNGYKLSCANGSQFDPEERDEMYNDYISRVKIRDIPELCSFITAIKDRLWYLGGDKPLENSDYAGRTDQIINLHDEYIRQVKSFLTTEYQDDQRYHNRNSLSIAYCPFHGTGYRLFPEILRSAGFTDVKSINGHQSRMGLNELNGLFPAFKSDSGREQQPDPGDPRAAETALRAFKEDYPDDHGRMDILIGTDPDADRCGLAVKVPVDQKYLYENKNYYLLPADDMWTLIIWYRLFREMEHYGFIPDADKKFITLSHTTSDSLTFLARKYGVGVVKSWVGFASLAAATRDIWNKKTEELSNLNAGHDSRYFDKCHPYVCECLDMNNERCINIGIMEQSNGFSLLGGSPPDGQSLGIGGHVRDKDGLLAGLLLAEIAAWAKKNGMTLIDILDRYLYLDPEIGMFMTFYEPDPLDGEYPSIEGDRRKKTILQKAFELSREAGKGNLVIAGCKITSSNIYRTGKYDRLYPPTEDYQFPDEGIRLYLDNAKWQYLTIRPSGTSNSLRFHIQLHALPTESDLLTVKEAMREKGRMIMDELRERLGASRNTSD